MSPHESDTVESFADPQCWSDDTVHDAPSAAVLSALTTLADDPTGFSPLNDTVDLDALDALFTDCGSGTVTFRHAGYHVTVDADGEALVRALD